MEQYSQRFERIASENAFKVGPHITRAESGGRQVIRLNLGEPDFELPNYIAQEVKRQLDDGNTRYCDPQGVLPLRQVIAHHLSVTRELEISPEQVVVFPGAKPAIALSQHAYLNRGEEVIYPSPGFPIYESMIRVNDAVPVPLHLKEENDFSFTAEELASLITPATKLIFLNFPSNPTGGVATREELEEVAQLIAERCHPSCRVFSDEIYEDILFDGKVHTSIASIPGMRERTIISSGFSKSFCWTGGRIGYAAFPTAEEAGFFRNLNINYFSCVPPFLQMAAAEALRSSKREAVIGKMVAAFERRRDYVVPALNELEGVSCRRPSGAFYVFPNIASLCRQLGAFQAFEKLPPQVRLHTSPSTLFQMFALYHHQVAVMDRRSFGQLGSENQHYLRLSIAASIDNLKEGIRRLAAAGQDRDGFEKFIARGRDFVQ